jgi:hypothetical protein
LQKKKKPDFEKLCALAKKLETDIGKNYQNSFMASKFSGIISDNLKDDLISKVFSSKFVSVLADGSTDSSVQEQEVVYLRYLENGKAITSLVDIVSLEHAHAERVYTAIESALQNYGLDFQKLNADHHGTPTLVCANFDGASVMLGKKSGVITHIQRQVPQIIPIHCVAHKLELAILDAVKNLPFLKKYYDTIRGLFIMYRASPKRLRDLQAISNSFEVTVKSFTDLKKVNINYKMILKDAEFKI